MAGGGGGRVGEEKEEILNVRQKDHTTPFPLPS